MAATGTREPFDPRVVAGLVAAGVLAFFAFLLLSTFADSFAGTRRDGRAHALSVAATGYAGAVRLAGESGLGSRLIRDAGALGTEDLVVVTPEDVWIGPPDDRGWLERSGKLRAFLAARGARTTLIVLPKWLTQAHPARAGWVRSVGGAGKPGHGGVARGVEFLDGLTVPMPTRPATARPTGWRPLLIAPDGEPLLLQRGQAPLYLLIDPDLLNNHGLRDAARARGAMALLAALKPTGSGPIAFDLTVNGLGARPSAAKLLWEPPVLPFTIALFVAALLAGLAGWVRFGPARAEARGVAFGKATLVANVAGVVRMAGAEHRMGPAYADAQGERALRAAGAPPLPPEARAAFLDRLGPEPFSALADRLRQAGGRDELVRAARALHSWVGDLKR